MNKQQSKHALSDLKQCFKNRFNHRTGKESCSRFNIYMSILLLAIATQCKEKWECTNCKIVERVRLAKNANWSQSH